MFHNLKKLVRPFLFLIGALFAFSSCSITRSTWVTQSSIPVKIDAYSERESLPKKVAFLVCNDERIPKSDLKNRQLEGYLKKALTPRGYSFTDNIEEANISIFYEYGISNPRYYTAEKIVPVWGVTGIGASVTTTQAGRNIITGRPQIQSTTINTPMYGQVGERVVTETTAKFLCWANISAYDADYYRKTGEDKMLWLTEITSETENDNLREIFPYMMAAAKENIGQSRSERIHYNIPSSPDHPSVIDIKGGTPVTVRLNQDTKGKKDPQATVVYDVYRDGELIIRAGTPVKMEMKRDYPYWKAKNSCSLTLQNFSTTSVYGNNVSLKGNFTFNGARSWGKKEPNDSNWNYGAPVAHIWGAIFFWLVPVSVPYLVSSDYRAKVPAGTLLYFEIK